MREIKFRAWDKLDKKMINWRDTADNDELLGQLIMFPDEDMFILMQYTGLKDKNGVEIYEGDILKINKITKYLKAQYDNDNFKIEWQNDKGWWTATPINLAENGIEVCPDPEEWTKYCEVIGNIYENPELIKEPLRGRSKAKKRP